MNKNPKDTTVGPWARDKLEALGQYLGYYTKVLKNQAWCRGTFFVDAFAGPGISQIRTKSLENGQSSLFQDTEAAIDDSAIEFLKGSPRVALDIADPFSCYVFIELDPGRVEELEALQKEYGESRQIKVRRGDANSELMQLLSSGIDWRSCRGVVFLDPWGMQVSWATIESLAHTRAIEVIVNFPLGMAIHRLLTKSGDIPESWQVALDDYFGTPEWRQHVYEETNGLFGPTISKFNDSGLRLLKWYRGRLRTVFGHVSTARLIRNTKGGHLYYLIWAGPHKMGLKGADYILSKGEKITRSGQKGG